MITLLLLICAAVGLYATRPLSPEEQTETTRRRDDGLMAASVIGLFCLALVVVPRWWALVW